MCYNAVKFEDYSKNGGEIDAEIRNISRAHQRQRIHYTDDHLFDSTECNNIPLWTKLNVTASAHDTTHSLPAVAWYSLRKTGYSQRWDSVGSLETVPTLSRIFANRLLKSIEPVLYTLNGRVF